MNKYGDSADKVQLVAQLRAQADTAMPPGHRSRARTMANLGRYLNAYGFFEKAEPLLLAAETSLADAGTPDEDQQLAYGELARCYEGMKSSERADHWRAKLSGVGK